MHSGDSTWHKIATIDCAPLIDSATGRADHSRRTRMNLSPGGRAQVRVQSVLPLNGLAVDRLSHPYQQCSRLSLRLHRRLHREDVYPAGTGAASWRIISKSVNVARCRTTAGGGITAYLWVEYFRASRRGACSLLAAEWRGSRSGSGLSIANCWGQWPYIPSQ